MADGSAKNLYQQSRKLVDQLPIWPYMNNREQLKFVEEVRDLLHAATEYERGVTSKRTKSDLRKIIDQWEKFLNDILYGSSRDLPIVSKLDKTAPGLRETNVEETSTTDFTRSIWSQVAGLVSQLLSSNKVDSKSPPSVPHDPRLRAIYDELYGIVDSNGHTK